MNKRTAPVPPVDLADPVWTVEHVARAFRLAPRATRTLVATQGFPAAFRTSTARTARLYWRREDILDYVSRGTPATPDSGAGHPDTDVRLDARARGHLIPRSVHDSSRQGDYRNIETQKVVGPPCPYLQPDVA